MTARNPMDHAAYGTSTEPVVIQSEDQVIQQRDDLLALVREMRAVINKLYEWNNCMDASKQENSLQSIVEEGISLLDKSAPGEKK